MWIHSRGDVDFFETGLTLVAAGEYSMSVRHLITDLSRALKGIKIIPCPNTEFVSEIAIFGATMELLSPYSCPNIVKGWESGDDKFVACQDHHGPNGEDFEASHCRCRLERQR